MVTESKKNEISNEILEVNSDMDFEDQGITTIVSPYTGKVVNITGDVDEAMKYADNEKVIEIDEKTNRRILLKIDMCLMPIMCLLYCFQFMDKLSNSFASILGLREDLNMVGDMYSWTGTSFYLGYLVFEFPASMLLQRFPVVKTVSVFIIIWGVILCLHSIPQYAGFIALRTVLGMLESSVTPAFVILTSQWYKKEEQFIRTALWFSCNGIGMILGSGAIAYNVSIDQENYSLEAWKLIFIITGCLTIFLGFVIMLHFPDTPTKAWFLNDEEKSLVVERIRTNQQGFGNKHFKKHQFIEALLDFKTWLFFIFSIANNIPNGGITNFGSILLTGMGYSPANALLMQMPSGAVEVVGCTLLACGVLFYPYRLFWATVGTVIVIISECMLAFSSNVKVQYAGFCLYTLSPIGFICLLSIIASNVAGHTKKVTTNAIFLIGYCVGNLIGPQTFIDNQAPEYTGAKISIVVNGCVSLVVLILIWYSYWVDNKKRDNNFDKAENVEHLEFADLTDKENPAFRYEL